MKIISHHENKMKPLGWGLFSGMWAVPAFLCEAPGSEIFQTTSTHSQRKTPGWWRQQAFKRKEGRKLKAMGYVWLPSVWRNVPFTHKKCPILVTSTSHSHPWFFPLPPTPTFSPFSNFFAHTDYEKWGCEGPEGKKCKQISGDKGRKDDTGPPAQPSSYRLLPSEWLKRQWG